MPTRYTDIQFGSLDLASPDPLVRRGALRTCQNLIPRNGYKQPAEGSVAYKAVTGARAVTTHSRQVRGVLSTLATSSLERKIIVTSSDVQIYDEALDTLTTAYTFANTDSTRKAQFSQVKDVLFIACSVGEGVGSPEVLLMVQDDSCFELDVPDTPYTSLSVGTSPESFLAPGLYAVRHGYVLADGTCIGLSPPRIIDITNDFTVTLLTSGAIAVGDTTFTVASASSFASSQAQAVKKGRDPNVVWVGGEKVQIQSFNTGTGVATLVTDTQFGEAHADASNVVPNDGYYMDFGTSPWSEAEPWQSLIQGVQYFLSEPLNNAEDAFSVSYFDVGVASEGMTSFKYTKTAEAIVEGEVLDDSNLLVHKPSAAAIGSYNGKLILGDAAFDFARPVISATDATGSNNYRLGVQIQTSTSLIERISEERTFVSTTLNFLSNFITYPDRRVVKFIVYMDNGSGDYKKAVEYPAKKGTTTNLSYHYFESGAPTISLSGGESDMPDLTTVHAVVDRDRNRVMVSEALKPLSLLAQGSGYRVGDTDDDTVVAFASNSSPVSEGQFGVYPYFVLCRNSIWAFQVDNFGTFVSLQPIETFRGCVSRYGVVNIGKIVAYVAHDGIWTLPTRRNIPLSQDLHERDGTGFVSLLDSDTALGYFNDTTVGRRELWVAAGGIVYGYSLTYSEWFTLDRDRIQFHDHENTLFAVDSTGVVTESGSADQVDFSLVTAPIHVGRNGMLKKFRRIGLRLLSDDPLDVTIKDQDGIRLFEGELQSVYFDKTLNVQMGLARHITVELSGTFDTATQLTSMDIEWSPRQRQGMRVFNG